MDDAEWNRSRWMYDAKGSRASMLARQRLADPEYEEDPDDKYYEDDWDDDGMFEAGIAHYVELLHVGETPQEVLETNSFATDSPTRKQRWAMRGFAERLGLSEMEFIKLAIRLKRVHPKRSGAMLAELTRPEIGGIFEIKHAYEALPGDCRCRLCTAKRYQVLAIDRGRTGPVPLPKFGRCDTCEDVGMLILYGEDATCELDW